MTLLSTKDDFLERTLSSIPGLLGKLEYMSALRENGRYNHWGLERIYGEEATQRALSEVHRSLFVQMLRMPLRNLIEDLACSVATDRSEMKIYLESLKQQPRLLLPPDLGGGSMSHFNSVVGALLALLG
jgi:hypothetical protein